MTTLFSQAKYIIENEGIGSLISRLVKHGIYLHQVFIIYDHILREIDASGFNPRTDNFTFKLLQSWQEAEQLIAGGYDLQIKPTRLKHRLEKGAPAFCVFFGKHLASIGFVAVDRTAKDALGQPPYQVDFLNNEACTGGGWTDTRYRGTGFATYIYFERLKYLRERGKHIARAAVLSDNASSHALHAKFKPEIRGELHIFRIMGLVLTRQIQIAKGSKSTGVKI